MNHPSIRSQVEDLLYLEASLLDAWNLEQWLALYTKDATYQVPSTDLPPDANPDKALFYIADDRLRMEQRVIRLMKKGAHAEQPRSKTRHLVTNVRVVADDGKEIQVSAAFAVYRSKTGHTDVYVGGSQYCIIRLADLNEGQKETQPGDDGLALLIKSKRCTLDMENLRPHGRISIIL